MISGLGPALKLSKTDLVADLKALAADGSPVLGRRFSARNVMVVGQIALSLMLLSAGGLFARGALKAASANPGFSYDRQLLVVHRSDARAVRRGARPRRAIADRAGARPRAARRRGRRHGRVGAVRRLPRRALGRARRRRAVRSRRRARAPTYRIIGADYFRALNLPMVRGREFTEAEEMSRDRAARGDRRRAARAQAVRRRRSARADDPLHRRVPASRPRTTGSRWRSSASPRRSATSCSIAKPGPAIYEPWGRNYRGSMFLHVRAAQAGTESDLLAAIRREMRAYDPRLPVLQATTMHAFHDRSIELWAVQRRRAAVPRLRRARAAARRGRALRREVVHRVAAHARDRDPHGARRAAARRAVDGAEGRRGAGGGRRRARACRWRRCWDSALSSMLYDVKPLDPVVFMTAPRARWLRSPRWLADLAPAPAARTRVRPGRLTRV